MPGRTGSVSVPYVRFSPDGKVLGTDDLTGTIRFWDAATWHRIGAPVEGHQSAVAAVEFSPDGRVLASAGLFEGTVRLWDVATHAPLGGPIASVPMTRWNLTFTPDSATLLVGGGGGVRFFDVGTRRAAGPPLPDPAKDIGALAGSPDGRLLATGGATGTIRLWRVQQWNIARPADLRAAVCGIAHRRPIAYLALFAANGFAIGWRRAYDVSIGITSPAGSRVLVLAWFLSVAGWLLVPAVVGGIAGYVVSDAITSRRTRSAEEIFTRDDDE